MIRRLPLPVPYLAVLLISLYFAIVFGEKLALLAPIFLLCCLLKTYSWKKTGQVLCILLVFGTHIGFHEWQKDAQSHSAPQTIQSIQILADTISVNGDSLSFRGKSQGHTYQAFYKLKSEEEQSFFKNLNQTLVLDVEAELVEPESQRNFKGFDYKSYLKNQGIYRLAQIKTIKGKRLAEDLSLFDRMRGWRRKALVYIENHFPAPMSHYMTGLLFGHLSKDFQEMSDLYSSLGIIHLFALSGMQVGFFVGAFRFICLRLGLRKDLLDVLTVPFSLIYAGLTGFSVSVIRSLFQLNLSSLFGLKKLDNLAITVMVMFFIMPDFLSTVGGVLSFAYAFILAMTNFEGRKHPKLAEMLSINLGILPLLCWYFSAFQPFAIVLTALVSILFDRFILPVLSLVFLLSPLVTVSVINPFFLILEKGLTLVSQMLRGPLVFGSPALGILLLCLVCLGLLYDFSSQKKWVYGIGLILALLFFLTKHPMENEVTVLDVGQGDSIFLHDILGKTVLIDTGGRVSFGQEEAWREKISDSNAERTSIPYLKSRGVSKIDSLVLTHTEV